MNLTEEWKKHLEELTDPEQIDVSSFEVKETLNPELWDSPELLNEEIGDRLYEIAKEFFKNLDLDWVDIVDVILTGSLANFTWSRFSDIDLHILIDYKQVDENQDLVQDYLRKSSGLWNKNHNILIKDFEVEIYIQDVNEPHYSGGVYSVKDDRWIEVPSREDPQIDFNNVQKKAANLMDDVDEVSELFLNKEYELALSEAERIRDRIRKFRQSGLEEGGVFSVENLAFKVLRRNNYLQKLASLRIMSYDRTMSINGVH
jgi:predicted nucleotidyltransferase